MKILNDLLHSKLPSLLTVSFAALLVSACGGGSIGGGTGTLGVSLTDAPACGFKEVNVTVAKVRVHQSSTVSDKSKGWEEITLNLAQKINLLDLNNGVLLNLGETTLPAGHYTQLRLVLETNLATIPPSFANSVVPVGGTDEIALDTPSAVQSGIKLINEFNVAAGQRVDLVLDFNACKSIVKRGNGTYGLKPVIKVVPFVQNGIQGYVATGLLNKNVMVTAQQNSEVIQSTAPMADGKFILTRLAPGYYDVVFTADGHATVVITDVPVASTTSMIDVSDIGTPISLQTSLSNHSVSGAVTMNPPSTEEVAYVTAKQTIGVAPTVTVESVAADDIVSPHAYMMTLPSDEPWLGQYAGSLPVTIFAQSGVAGAYTMEASANGYQTSTPVAVDVSTNDVTNVDFVLQLSP